jgi:glycosyltransferase involved in cell wall biosynthesis
MNEPTDVALESPLVTLGMPVHNGENYLAAALESLLAQDYPNLEILIADNASTDRTPDLLREVAQSDSRVTILWSDVNNGAAWNFNRLFSHAHGEYMKWVAHDDLMAPAFVRECMAALAEAPQAVLAYPKTRIIDDAGQPVRDFEDGMDLREPTPSARLRHFLQTQTEYHPLFGVVRRTALERTGLIRSNYGSDVNLLAELAMLGEWREVPSRMFFRRMHANTSMNAYADADDRATWLDPSNAGKPALIVTRITAQLLRSVREMPLSVAERRKCRLVVLRSWALPRARLMQGELRRGLVKRAKRAAGRVARR